MNTTVENITFIVIRGIIALAIIGVGFYCISQGIHYFALPRIEAEQIRISLLGLEITANGLGAVIFGTGIALCFIGKRTAPNRIETTRNTESLATNKMATPSGGTLANQAPISDKLAEPDFNRTRIVQTPYNTTQEQPSSMTSSSRTIETVVLLEGNDRNKNTNGPIVPTITVDM